MPNNIHNIVIFHGKDDDIKAVKKAIKGNNVVDTYKGKEVQSIDFDVIVPQPEGLLETEGWYGWRITHWGTKWNAYDSEPCNDNELIFDTAWSCPMPIYEKLHEICGDRVSFEVKYADEDIGYNCGAFSFDKEGKHPGVTLQMGSEEAIVFAKEVWDFGE